MKKFIHKNWLPDIPVFIDVYMPIAGWKARKMVWDDEMKFHEPWETSPIAFQTKKEARQYARQWAKDEEIPFIETCPGQTEDAPNETVEEQLKDILGPIETIHLD